MTSAFSIEPGSGSLCVGEARFAPYQTRAEIEPQITHLVERSRDHGNGYAWLYLHSLSFGGQPAIVSLCFQDGRLEQAGWGVTLPDAAEEDGWPTRGAIDAEIAFVRKALAENLGFGPNWKSPMTFKWGEIWSSFDAKGGFASNGLRYRPA